jgi:hypothetical protein
MPLVHIAEITSVSAMPRRAKQRSKPEVEDARVAIRVERYQAEVDAAINHDVYAPQYALHLNDDDPLYAFTSQLRILGVAIYPEARIGDIYDLTIYGDDAPSRRLNATLKDAHARDQHGSPQYRTYRGREISVYTPPMGMGLVDKIRGEKRWTAWLHTPPRFVNDALTLLAAKNDIFLAIHVRKMERTRWVQRVTLQTSDPREE